MLLLDGVTKEFGTRVAVDRVSCAIQSGESVAVIGPNGAGKTTLFNIISGFLRPSEGEVFVDGRPVTGMKPHELHALGVARSFQVPKPFHEMTVEENLKVVRQSKEARDRHEVVGVVEVMEAVGLSKYQTSLSSTLGVGQLRRLELGRVLMSSPKILLLDEPFAGLTTEEVSLLQQTLAALKTPERTFIIVEHRIAEVFRMVERTLVLHGGAVIADQLPSEVIRNPVVLDAYFGEKGAESLGLA